MSDMWLPEEQDPRTQESPVGELATLRDYLSNYRITLELKCSDLDAEQLARRSVPPSTLSLLGLVRHLAGVEHSWFRRVLQENLDLPFLFRRGGDRESVFDDATADPAMVEEAFSTWRAEIAAADEWLDRLAEQDLGREVPLHDGLVSIREVLVHLIEEYARHAGHADLLRECIDGRTGQ